MFTLRDAGLPAAIRSLSDQRRKRRFEHRLNERHAAGMAKKKRWCHAKHRHLSEGAAQAQMRSLERRGLLKPGERPYKCRNCFGWHIGAPTIKESNAA